MKRISNFNNNKRLKFHVRCKYKGAFFKHLLWNQNIRDKARQFNEEGC